MKRGARMLTEPAVALRPRAARRASKPAEGFRWDAAATTPENRKHWASADNRSANAANSPEVRQRLRSRSRYERDNNSFYKGITRTYGYDVIGTGCRLQIKAADVPGMTEKEQRLVERTWRRWAKKIHLAQKLRLMRQARLVDGESFGLLVTDKSLDSPIKLNMVPIEAERVASPAMSFVDPNKVDGIELSPTGDPLKYHILKQHPGGLNPSMIGEYDTVPAQYVVQYFEPDRAEQHRGVPELVASLPLGAYLRRYTLATVSTAELQACLTLTLESETPAESEGVGPADDFEELDIARGQMTVLPAGTKINQVESTQPTSEYGPVRDAWVGEMARPINMPRNIATCDSSGYNYASGRLDHQTYFLSIRVDRQLTEERALDDRIFPEFWRELVTIEGFTELARFEHDEIEHDWIWDGREYSDPEKAASADEIGLRTHQITYAEVYGKRGKDWEAELRQRGRETKLLREQGLIVEPTGGGSQNKQNEATVTDG